MELDSILLLRVASVTDKVDHPQFFDPPYTLKYLQAGLQHRLSQFGHGGGKPRRAPRLERRLDERPAAKWQRRLYGFERKRATLFDRRAPLVQLRELALRIEQDRSRRRAGDARLAELDFEFAWTPGERRIDDVFNRKRRRVGNDSGDVLIYTGS